MKYYGVTRTDEYLAHYGVKGMKWGVRKAIERGSERALDRQWRKANRKLRKLTKLGVNKEKYKKRAIGYGAGAAALGSAALAGTGGVSRGIGFLMKRSALGKEALSPKLKEFSEKGILAGTIQGKRLSAYSDKLMENAKNTMKRKDEITKAITDYGNGDSIAKRLVPVKSGKYTATLPNGTTMEAWSPDLQQRHVLRKITNDQYLRGAAALGAAGLGVAAARNAYRAKTANRNMIRAAEWKREMDRTFAGTKYGKKRRRSNA